jgi:hypothetical protein
VSEPLQFGFAVPESDQAEARDLSGRSSLEGGTTVGHRSDVLMLFRAGARIVVHSDLYVVGGVAVVRDPELAERIGFLQNAMGTCAGPQDCFLVLRGIMTLAPRMEEHNGALRCAGR